MSLTLIRPYFRTQMDALGFREWKDAFNFENIPSNILDNSYHIETPSGSRRNPYDPQLQDIEHDVTIRVFFKGFRDAASAVDKAMLKYDAILTRVLDSERRLGTSLKNIYLNNTVIRPLSDSNDNGAILEINFICLIFICV